MGYDMRLHRPTPEMVEAGHQAWQAFRVACDARDAIPGNVPNGDQMRAGSTYWNPERDVLPDGWVIRDDRGEQIAGLPEWCDAQIAVGEAMRLAADAAGEFRLNIWGMDLARQVMARAGMVHAEGEENAPPWTGVNDCPLCEADAEGHDHGECHLEREPRLSWAPEYPGIPVWKFGSNDGWLVGPIECRSALDAWDKLDSIEQVQLLTEVYPDGLTWWPRWIRYLALGAAGHGFTVS